MAKTLLKIFGVVLLLVCAADLRVVLNPAPAAARTSNWPTAGDSPRPPDWPPTARRCPPGFRRRRLAPGAADASHGAADPGGRRRLPEPVLRQEPAHRGAAGPLQAGLVVSHHVHRARRPADLSAGLPRHQLSRRDLAQRPPRRRRPADRRHVQRPRPRRQPVDPARQAQHPGGEGHPGRAIQDVDGVELADSWYDWINWRYLGCKVPTRTRPTATRSSRTETPASGSRCTSGHPVRCRSARPPSTPNCRCPTPTAPG